MATTKLTVSIPEEMYHRLENTKESKKISRSELVQVIVRTYFQLEDEKILVEKYITGYQKIPERIEEIKTLEATQMNVLNKEF